jgi:hypothetical protein
MEGRMKTHVLMVVLATGAIAAIATVKPPPPGPVIQANRIAANVAVKSDILRVKR